MKNDEAASAKLIALEARVAVLEGKRLDLSSVTEVDQVRITYPQPASVFVMPSEAELSQLLSIVLARFDNLRPKSCLPEVEEEEMEYFGQFRAAFRALGYLNRSDALDSKHAATYWVDASEELLRGQGAPATISLGAFTAAAVAHVDVPYAPLVRFPHELGFGLALGGTGRRAADRWKQVLATGKLALPTEPPRTTNYPTSPVRMDAAV